MGVIAVREGQCNMAKAEGRKVQELQPGGASTGLLQGEGSSADSKGTDDRISQA